MMNFNELNTLVKYCYNRIDAKEFFELMRERYDEDENYINSKWPEFRNNPLLFIVGRNEKELYEKEYSSFYRNNYNSGNFNSNNFLSYRFNEFPRRNS